MADMKLALQDNRLRVGAIVVLLALALFGVYRYSTTVDASAQAATIANSTTAPGSTGSSAGGGGAGGGMACCSGGSSTPVEGAATVEGGVQKITVNVGGSGYEPNVVKLKAGVRTEITFGQSQGCTGSVQSQDLGFQADLTAGPQTVKLAALQPGTYGFACGMGMVTGQIVVQ
jgi:Cupredoxin-like domain